MSESALVHEKRQKKVNFSAMQANKIDFMPWTFS